MIIKPRIETLLYQRYLQKVSYEELSSNFEDKYSDMEIRDFIFRIAYSDIKTRLVEEAKEHFAKKFNCKSKEVLYDDYDEFAINMPYVCIVGNVKIEVMNCSKLKYVSGSLHTKGATGLGNLEYVGELADINGMLTYDRGGNPIRQKTSLTKLKHCKQMFLTNVTVNEINVADLDWLKITGSKVKKLNVINIDELNVIPSSYIEDFTSAGFIRTFKFNNERVDKDNMIKYINPSVLIDNIYSNYPFSSDTDKIDIMLGVAKQRGLELECSKFNEEKHDLI